jgi:UDP-glucose 4-epimerase
MVSHKGRAAYGLDNLSMRCLVTGGAGFIGSNLVDALLARGDEVRVLDDLSTGHRDNVDPQAELVEAEVSDAAAVLAAVDGCEVVFHQAAHRAVLRSVEDPLATDTANVHGTLTVLDAAHQAGVRRVVYASSSSVYGGAAERPTPETAALLPHSPYAVTKLTGEHYCRVFSELHGLETVALRYFNAFGPRQRPDSMYAAVIPLFIDALRTGQRPIVHGDGKQSRDFTYISDVVAANLAAASAPAAAASGNAYNIACGGEHSLLDLLEHLGEILGVDVDPEHTDPRAGDVRHSCADVTAATRDLDWRATVSFRDGLDQTVAALLA